MNKKFLNYTDWQGTKPTRCTCIFRCWESEIDALSSTSRVGTRASLLDGGRGIHGDYTR